MAAFLPVVQQLQRSRLVAELAAAQTVQACQGLARLPKGLLSSAVAQTRQQNLLVITATLEEAARWAVQLEAMGWAQVLLYPTSESSPYDPFDPESDLTWGQLQVLAEWQHPVARMAVITTERALQPHLPPPQEFEAACLTLQQGMSLSLKDLADRLARLGYEQVSLVEQEGQWSQRGDLVDIYPVAHETPLRLEWFGDELEAIKEFDPGTQRSTGETIATIQLTPTSFLPLLQAHLPELNEGYRRYLGVIYDQPASLMDYLPVGTTIAIDEPEQCLAHHQRWYDHVGAHWQSLVAAGQTEDILPFHQPLDLSSLDSRAPLHLSELAIEDNTRRNVVSRSLPVIPHQFGNLAQTVKQARQNGQQVWLLSAQPSRTVALLQEHDCPAQFILNPKDAPAIARLQDSRTPVALKYAGLAELEGFVLPLTQTLLLTDREFFGQHTLATPSYSRKRRRSSAKQVDPNQLKPGDFVVHKHHGIGRFLQLESLVLNNEVREYLVIQYDDGQLRVAADQLNTLSRYRATDASKPALNKMSSKAWEKTRAKVRKALQKVAFDLLELYARRAEQRGYAYPLDQPWQQEMEDSFPYQPTPDQLKSTQDVKRDMESDRPMDRLVCGDVGFGKTEVAIRAIFKAVLSHKQVALLVPTTILAQQHYHTLRERFAPYPIQVGLLNRFRTASERKEILGRLATGELDIVVGTHQLLGKGVQFKDLGLLVIDEEQRFGVNQKEKIKSYKTQVDVLTLSATPIPRTLYMALSGVREMSLITTPPPARRPIQTHLHPYDAEMVYTAIRQELDRGGQIFYVVNRVEGIEEIAAKLHLMLPSLRIAIAHGQLPEGELESTMLAFSSAEADVLLCTTIVESGLDIPRVNTIIVENAEFFGLSQLYQLRGRVGRAGIQAHAWLFYRNAATLSDDARKRLRAIQEFTQLGSGYQLAMRDMEIRGVGNLLGTQQSGQLNAVGFDLYMEMLQEAIAEIRGQEIPSVDDTQIDLNITAMVPQQYIADADQKMAAYRQVASAASRTELQLIALDWGDRYGQLPPPVEALLRVMELKLVAKSLGFSRIKPQNEHVLLETPMAEPAWNRLKEGLPAHLRSRFVYQAGKVTVRGLGQQAPSQQLDSLIQWLTAVANSLESSPTELAIVS